MSMLSAILILSNASGVLLFEKNIKNIEYDSKIFSGLLIAVQSVCREINIGECNTFGSENYQVLTAKANYVVVALIVDKNSSYAEDYWELIAFEIGEEFEKNYNLKEFKGRISQFKNFNQILNNFLITKGLI